MFKPCIVIPFYNHEGAIAQTLASIKSAGLPCWLVDDGSDQRCTAVLEALAAREVSWLHLIRYRTNAGKGQAVMVGCAAANQEGFTHALQLDADGQHDVADIPKLLALAESNPTALITGVPIYDDSVPRGRLYGRYITHFWVWIHTLSFQIKDSMCGYRVYPLASTLDIWNTQHIGRRMDFDIEIMVRMFWAGASVLSVPTKVTYPLDGVSHFNMTRDNLRISWMHTKLFFGMLARLPRLLWQRFSSRRSV
ncbi:glycosyltransferase family 2 protein [Stenotrophobium rhamnosiphilum]|uniref:Glycosyl transferase n=1 Tax=Stenotrophobium rhamnosiphilum TaxID=2029166 RepID=A0A2T5MFR9_9GAMM|nr:glycosyltransferase family 2 protein [Stenotrophobium rhamnosiphilum]PTU31399.1 glycosyl transferase [Stenotrophobium rhamnosiphilum]